MLAITDRSMEEAWFQPDKCDKMVEGYGRHSHKFYQTIQNNEEKVMYKAQYQVVKIETK